MKIKRIYLEKPIYRYMCVNGEVVVDKFVKTKGRCSTTVYTEDEKKNTSIGTLYEDKEFDTFLTQNQSMLSFDGNKQLEYEKMLVNYLVWRRQRLIEEHDKAIHNIDRTLELLQKKN